MPKLLDNVGRTLIGLARKRLLEIGYTRFAVRDVAKEAGIATGTLYNYFSSKLELVAAVMLEDWLDVLALIDGIVASAAGIPEALHQICACIGAYCRRYHDVWEQSLPSAEVRGKLMRSGDMHCTLRKHLAQRIKQLFARFSITSPEHAFSFVAENLLAAATSMETLPGYAAASLEYLGIIINHIACLPSEGCVQAGEHSVERSPGAAGMSAGQGAVQTPADLVPSLGDDPGESRLLGQIARCPSDTLIQENPEGDAHGKTKHQTMY